jgi:hypothetical protein
VIQNTTPIKHNLLNTFFKTSFRHNRTYHHGTTFVATLRTILKFRFNAWFRARR